MSRDEKDKQSVLDKHKVSKEWKTDGWRMAVELVKQLLPTMEIFSLNLSVSDNWMALKERPGMGLFTPKVRNFVMICLAQMCWTIHWSNSMYPYVNMWTFSTMIGIWAERYFFEDMRKQIVRVRKNKHKWKIRTSRVEVKTEKGNRSLPTLPKYLRLWPRYDFKRHNISNDSLRALTMWLKKGLVSKTF